MPRRKWTLTLAAGLFAGVTALRFTIETHHLLVTLLYVLPIALVAVELGAAWGLAAATAALAMFGLWDVASDEVTEGAVDYVIRGAVFFVLGGSVGALADRLRAVSSESTRFWELSTDLLCTAGFDGHIQRLNPAWEHMLGWTPAELRERPFVELVHPDDREKTESEAAGLATAASETVGFENRYRCKDGSYRTLAWNATSVPAEELIYATARDVTDRERADQEARAAHAEVERANRAKSEFLSRMSHELRTPLNAVIGFGQLLELDGLDERQRESVGQILKAARHLLDLINEVLDISRIESGSMSMSLESVHLGSVVAEVLSLIRPLADEAEVRLVCDPSECSDFHLLADQQRLKQVLINLLSNAVKYNRRGGEVSVHCGDTSDGRVEITVANTGPGMSAEQLERLFEPFDRLGAEGGDIEGTGLGLSLSRGLVDAMGGTISAESEPGADTTMRVELARADDPGEAAASAIGAAAADRHSQERGSILYIEGNLSNLKLVERLLDRLPDVRLIPAMQGQLGMDLARRHLPDLILLDLHLPDLHGREVLLQLKRDPATATIPVVVLSADATETQVRRLRADGVADYLTKPIDVDSLFATVSATLPAAGSPSS